MQYGIGDRVLLNSRNLQLAGSRKFKQCWLGPFPVVGLAGPVAYRVELPRHLGRVHPVFHVSLLRRFHAGGDDSAIPEPVVVDDQEEHEVEAIVGHCTYRGQL